MRVDVKIDGLRELDAALVELGSEFSKSMAKGAARRTLLKALEPMRDTAIALAPDDPATNGNDLKASITTGTASKLTGRQKRAARKDDRAHVTVYMGTADPAAVPQEFGTINHGPQAFMRPAYDEEAEPTLRRVGDGLGPEIEKTAERAYRRRAKKAAG